MSGGSMDYLYHKVEGAGFKENTTLRRAFRAHLSLVARALKAIEWNDSGDGDDGEDTAIRACLGAGVELEQARADLEKAIAEATAVLKRAKEKDCCCLADRIEKGDAP